MKRAYLGCILSALLVLTGCSSLISHGGNEAAYTHTVGACLSQTSVTPFGVHLYQNLRDQCEAHGWQLICLDAERDAAKQATQADAMLQMDIDLFLFWPADGTAGVTICRQFHDAGIPVVVMNADVDADGADYTTAFVGPDQYQIGCDIASYLMSTTQQPCSAVIISGGVASNQFIQRTQGFTDTIDDNLISIRQIEYSESDRSKAQTIMENYLIAYDDIDIVYCMSDNLALGAVNAIRAAGRPEIRVVSIDGMAEAFTAIQNCEIELTVLQPPSAEVDQFVLVAQQIFAGEALPQRNFYSTHTLITSQNVDQYTPAY